jgi:hypothetical protein
VTMKVYNTIGAEIATLLDTWLEAGSYQIPFTGASIASGVYWVCLRSSEGMQTRAMILHK